MRKYVDAFFSFGTKITNFFKIGLILEAGLMAAKKQYDFHFPAPEPQVNNTPDVRQFEDIGDHANSEQIS